MKMSGGNRFNRHWHNWTPCNNDISTRKTCVCGAVRYWNSKKWVIKPAKKLEEKK
jgi:hypothetical protein